MAHKKYGKIYHIDKEECEGILNGTCYIQEKIDGANLSVWMENGEIYVGSRTQTVGTDKIKNGFRGAVEYVNSHMGIKQLFEFLHWHYHTNDIRLYGEWLIPHTITNYNKEAYNHFYLYDIEIDGEKIGISDVIELANKYNINYPHLFMAISNPSKEELDKFIGQSKIGPVGEGIVIKNNTFINKFGDRNYAKMVSESFKEDNGIIFGNNSKWDNEMDITTKYCTFERIRKIMNKIYIEYLGAYDGWLAWEDKETGNVFHRNNDELVSETKQPIEYGPMFFKTESGKYYKNLYEITKEEYDNIGESKTPLMVK